jgi:hypothetical protein
VRVLRAKSFSTIQTEKKKKKKKKEGKGVGVNVPTAKMEKRVGDIEE